MRSVIPRQEVVSDSFVPRPVVVSDSFVPRPVVVSDSVEKGPIVIINDDYRMIYVDEELSQVGALFTAFLKMVVNIEDLQFHMNTCKQRLCNKNRNNDINCKYIMVLWAQGNFNFGQSAFKSKI